MERDEIIDILNRNKIEIEQGNWEDVYDDIVSWKRRDFSNFLIENDVNPSTLFKKYIPDNAFEESELLRSINISSTFDLVDAFSKSIKKILSKIK